MRKITNIPDVLAVQLKRYDSASGKNKNNVYPDPILDLSDIMISDTNYTKNVENSKYLLRCVITHKGETVNSGHYTTTIVEEEGSMFRLLQPNMLRPKVTYFYMKIKHILTT